MNILAKKILFVYIKFLTAFLPNDLPSLSLTVLVFLVVCFICTGCMGDVTRGIRHAGFTLSSNEFSCSLLLSNTSDVTYQKLKYVSTTQAITADGKIYDLSLYKSIS